MATESSRLERGRLSAKTHRLKKKNEINIMRETLSAQKVRIDQLETQTEKLQQQNDYLTKHIDWLDGGNVILT
jgi:predicted ribosome quality control (RQC) complex YloA/Tae2 family protein